MKKAALLSVSDRTGLIEFARGLQKLGYELLTTSGSGSFLSQHGIPSTSIEKYTGQKEILDGRVKTLHPRIYAGILARHDNPSDIAQLQDDQISLIEVVAVNLYPFEKNVPEPGSAEKGKTLYEMIELVDIGGPSMIRAAAKNHRFVYPVIDPADYGRVLRHLEQRSTGERGSADSGASELFRRELASKVFGMLAKDNVVVGTYFSNASQGHENGANDFAPISGMVLGKAMDMRYGENPHQRAAFYLPFGSSQADTSAATSLAQGWEQLSGKELSYNNMLDIDAAVRLIRSLGKSAQKSAPAVVIMKHLNPCGAAYGNSLQEALVRAKRSDPRSHFGGIIGCSTEVTREVAENIREDFAEIVVAPGFAEDALTVLRSSKNLRIIRIDGLAADSGKLEVEYRSCMGGMLAQEIDSRISDIRSARLASSRKLSDSEWSDVAFAWNLCAHVKSNAIVLVKDGTVIGVGAGQMSRIDSVELALSKARYHGHAISGAVAASDAFFPFPDSIETLAQAGVVAVVAPAGAKRDDESVATANRVGMSLLFSEDRHFRH